MWPNLHSPADLVTFTEEILKGKFHFLCSVKDSVIKENCYIPNKSFMKPTIKIINTQFPALTATSKALRKDLSYTTVTPHYKYALIQKMRNTPKKW